MFILPGSLVTENEQVAAPIALGTFRLHDIAIDLIFVKIIACES